MVDFIELVDQCCQYMDIFQQVEWFDVVVLIIVGQVFVMGIVE